MGKSLTNGLQKETRMCLMSEPCKEESISYRFKEAASVWRVLVRRRQPLASESNLLKQMPGGRRSPTPTSWRAQASLCSSGTSCRGRHQVPPPHPAQVNATDRSSEEKGCFPKATWPSGIALSQPLKGMIIDLARGTL